MALNDLQKKYQSVQPTTEGAPGANTLQPPGSGPMGLDALKNKYEQPGVMSDIGQTIVGLPRTGAEMLTGMGGGLFDIQSYIAGKIMKQAGWTDEQIAAKQAEWDKERVFSNPGEIRKEFTKGAEAIGVPEGVEEASRYQPKTRTGQVVQTAGLLAPSLLSGGGTLPANLISRVGIPTAMIEGGAEVGKAMGDETLGRLIGGAGAMAAPAAFNRVSSPYPAQPGRVQLAQTLEREGIPVSAGQRTGNERLMTRESVAGGVPALENQNTALTEAATRTQGGFPPGTNNLSRGAMRGELDRMGNEFDRLANISQAPFDNALQTRLLDATVEYSENAIIGTKVESAMNNLADRAAANGGRITGDVYKDTNSKITDIIRNTSDDAERQAFIAFKGALDDAVESNLSGADQGAWRTVRQHYRDFLPIERAKASPGGQSSRGNITPAALKAGVKAVEGPREIAAGSRRMTELAEAASAIMEKIPNSGTPQRLREQLAGLIPLATGGLFGSAAASANLPAALTGAAATGGAIGAAALPALRNAWIRSDVGQAMAGRQGPRFPEGSRVGLAEMLAAARAAQVEQEDQQRNMRGPR